MGWSSKRQIVIVASVLAASAGVGFGQVDPLSGTDFVTVGAVGNQAFRSPVSPLDGRGSVDYEYAIGRLEVTSGQWVAFLNAVYDRPSSEGAVQYRSRPEIFGAFSTTPVNQSNPLALRWSVASGRELQPVTGISWRTAAMYCNWLHNDKQNTLEAFGTGAYDLNNLSSGTARMPGARYFLPTHDEWMKAVHYDPQKQNADGSVGGWWTYGNRSDQPFVGGPPGAIVNGQLATANMQWTRGDYGMLRPWDVMLGSYPSVTSPWGLLDVAGAASEWTETYSNAGGFSSVVFDGSRYDTIFSAGNDTIVGYGGHDNFDGLFSGMGFRLAMAIPTPGAVVALGVFCVLSFNRKR